LKTTPSIPLIRGVEFEWVLKYMNYIYYNKNLTEKAKENRMNPTVPEKIMWKILRGKQLGDYKFIRQKPIDNFIIDFYCSELLLAIEIDGDSHAFQDDYDAFRTKKLNAFGIKVIRYSNSEIIVSIDGVYEDLKNKINKMISIISPPDKGDILGLV